MRFNRPRPRHALQPDFPAALETRQLPSASPISAARHAIVRATASSPGVLIARDVVYEPGAGRAGLLDVYAPRGRAPANGWPVVLAIHGGGWRRFSKEQYGPKAAALVPDGFVVVAPNYTLSAKGSPSWPEAFDDVQNAVRWVKSHAAQFKLDSNRIAAMGESAGGHLAAMLGVAADDSARVRAVVSISGPTDLISLARESSDARPAVAQFLGGPVIRLRSRYRDASPIAHVTPDDSPMLLVHGSDDSLVPPIQSRQLSKALTAAGVRNRVLILSGVDHEVPIRAGGVDLTAQIAAFLRSVELGPAALRRRRASGLSR